MLRRCLASCVAVSILATGVSLSLAQDSAKPAQPPTAEKKADVVDLTMKAGNFKTFNELLKAADMQQTLKGPGPYTVFAPTDQAFAKLPKGKLDEWKKPENAQKLRDVLSFHVASGSFDAAAVGAAKTIKTMQGGSLHVKTDAGKVWVENAQVTKSDMKASNGIVHTVDAVLMPQTKE